jgi:hypothetical protein
VCDLCVMGISLVRLALDLTALLHSLRRLVSMRVSNPEVPIAALLMEPHDDNMKDNDSIDLSDMIVLDDIVQLECYNAQPYDVVENHDGGAGVSGTPAILQEASCAALRSTEGSTAASGATEFSHAHAHIVTSKPQFQLTVPTAVEENTVALNHILELKLMNSSAEYNDARGHE